MKECCVLGRHVIKEDVMYVNDSGEYFCQKHKNDFERYHSKGQRKDVAGNFKPVDNKEK